MCKWTNETKGPSVDRGTKKTTLRLDKEYEALYNETRQLTHPLTVATQGNKMEHKALKVPLYLMPSGKDKYKREK